MANSVNKVILIGNLGADPEVRHMQNGKPVCNLRVATSERWRDKTSGEQRERTEWHRVVVFNEMICGFVEKYLHKGSKVYLEGQLQTRKWQDQSGQDRYSTEVVLQNFNGTLLALDSRGGNGGRPYRRESAEHAAGGSAAGQSYGGGGGGGGAQSDLNNPDDEIPF